MFRLKIVFLSVVISGAVLGGFGLYALSVMDKVTLARIDSDILTLGEGHLAVRPPRDYWQGLDSSLRFIYGQEWSKELIVQVRDARDEILFKSPNWPEEIVGKSFHSFDHAMDASPPKPEDGARQGPPLEAYDACSGKRAGSAAQFTDRWGEVLRGTCEDDGGRLVLRPNPPPPRSSREPGRQEGSMPRIKKKPSFATIETASGTWRVGIMGTDRTTIMAGVNMASFAEDAGRYRRAFLAIVPVALLLLAAGGWVIADRAMRPIALITRTAERITERAMDRRVPVIETDRELARLADVINGMLDRLEKSFRQAVRFSADAAHELQTPLTILQGELDAAVQHAPVGSEEQQRYSELLEEVQRLKAVVQKLLILARVDAGKLELHLKEINLSEIVESACEDVEAIAPRLDLQREISPHVHITGDADLIRHIVSNLASNAVKYTREGGLIRFRLSMSDNLAYVTIENSSVPVPEEEREKIFDRFYRLDRSRTKAVPGAGLGLSLAREIARAHGGDLRLDSTSGSMVSFTLSLPRGSH